MSNDIRHDVLSRRDRWVGNRMRGSIPQLTVVAALPTARAEFAYCMVVLVGTPDIAYICLRNAGGTWGWREAATG